MNSEVIKDLIYQIDSHLDSLLPHSSDAMYAPLYSSARYSLLSPGKRLRPLLLLAVTNGYDIPLEQAIIPACAIEMIHTYSLIHDDLPCMDNDDLRRGRPTLHKVYPEWHALLTGDYLLTYAFELLTKAPHLTAEQKIKVLHYCTFYSGAEGIIGGQMIDLLSEGKKIDFSTQEKMHLLKTAALFNAALLSGAVIANLSSHDSAILKNAGEKMGISFQIIDDVLDEEGTSEELGKPAGSDRAHNKATAVSLLGISKAKEMGNQLLNEAKELLKQLSCPLPLLDFLIEKMFSRKR